MFTSRAEYRLLLRQDNADIRLTEKAYNLGLANEERLRNVEEKIKNSNELESFLRETSLKPGIINPILETIDSAAVDQAYRASQILTRPNMTLEKLEGIDFIKEKSVNYTEEVKEQAEINIKYKGYIEKERDNVAKLNRLETIKIPDDFDFTAINSLSSEAKQKMNKVRPKSIAQAGRISGVSPADINVLLIYLGR
jgi:tRNA uridine 5-carboxymethylaminomethyl modification enzyme